MTGTENWDLVKVLQQELQLRFYRELFGLDENDQPRNGGFTGIRGIFDEVQEFDFWSHRPKQFTPSEFNKMWDSWNADQKFNYVLSLISPADIPSGWGSVKKEGKHSGTANESTSSAGTSAAAGSSSGTTSAAFAAGSADPVTQGLPPQGPQFTNPEMIDQVYDELMYQVFQGTTEEVIHWLLKTSQGRYYARSGKTGEIMDSGEYIALYV